MTHQKPAGEPPEKIILKKIRKIQIRTNRMVNDVMAGEYMDLGASRRIPISCRTVLPSSQYFWAVGGERDRIDMIGVMADECADYRARRHIP